MPRRTVGPAEAVLPGESELSVQQAAHLLNVSCSFVDRLLEEGQLAGGKAGRERRVRLDALLAYKRRDDEARARALDRLASEAQDLDLGY